MSLLERQLSELCATLGVIWDDGERESAKGAGVSHCSQRTAWHGDAGPAMAEDGAVDAVVLERMREVHNTMVVQGWTCWWWIPRHDRSNITVVVTTGDSNVGVQASIASSDVLVLDAESIASILIDICKDMLNG